MSRVNHCTSICVLSRILDQLVSNLGLVRDEVAADLVGTQAQRTALSGANWALTPANWADASCAVLARRIAKSSALYLIFVADQRGASSTGVGDLSARDANISHASRAVGRAHAASDIMEAFVALGVPEVAVFFTAWSALVDFASTSAVSVGLVAVSSIVAETRVVGAVLQADGANTRVAFFAVIEAEGSILLFASRAVRKRLTSRAAGGLLPA